MKTLAKLIRTATIPPVMALITLLILRLAGVGFNGTELYVGILCLTVLPSLAYPLAAVIPPLKKRGRKAQRSLAVVLSMVGSLAGAIACLAAGYGKPETVLMLTYLASGMLIAVFSFGLRIQSSGHACGMSGPIALLSYAVSPWFLLGYLLFVPLVWSSLALKRHTARELALGAIIPVACFAIFEIVIAG